MKLKRFMKTGKTLVVVLGSALLLGACGAVFNGTEADPGVLGVGQTDGSVQAAWRPTPNNGTIGVRHFRQISDTFAVATGIPANNTTIVREYDRRKTSFSTEGEAGKVSSAMLLATMELGSFYCREALNNATTRPLLAGNINTGSAANQIGAAQRSEAIQLMARAFWRRDASAEEVALLRDLMVQLEPGLTAGNMLLGVCTVVAASTESISML